jgi:hypothetical protein
VLPTVSEETLNGLLGQQLSSLLRQAGIVLMTLIEPPTNFPFWKSGITTLMDPGFAKTGVSRMGLAQQLQVSDVII